MRKLNYSVLLLIMLFVFCNSIKAQDYQIDFTVQDTTVLPDSVLVENLDQNTQLTLNGDDVLHLLESLASINEFDAPLNEMKIFPNPMQENTTLEFTNSLNGDVLISVNDVTGRIVAIKAFSDLPNGVFSVRLSNLKSGTYFINVTTPTNRYKGTLVSLKNSENNPSINIVGVNRSISKNVALSSRARSTYEIGSIVEMQYNDGETLKFTAYFNDYLGLEEFIVTETQTIDFACILIADIENNLYRTIKIGNQIWTNDNLITTRLNDGTSIPKVSDPYEWTTATEPAYCWEYYDEQNSLDKNYGALYNWFTVETENLCPVGWHVPSKDEWSEFVFYLAANGYNYDGTIYTGNDIDEAGSKIGKALASTSGWATPTYGNLFSIGKDQDQNNSSGFDAKASGGCYMMTGTFDDPEGFLSNFWTSTAEGAEDAWTYFMYTEETLILETYYFKEGGYSVRCVKD